MNNDTRESRPVLHRLREARLQKGFTHQALAVKMRVSVAEVMAEEDPKEDISVSQLQRWSDALDVATSQLLVEADSSVALPGLTSERLTMMHRLAEQIHDLAKDHATRAFADGLKRQLNELFRQVSPMPALSVPTAMPSPDCSATQ